MDLRNDGKIVRERRGPLPINPKSQDSIDLAFVEEESLPGILSSGERVLLSTAEEVEIPVGCYGHICLRSTFARLGLLAPPTIADPGFKGTLTFEIYNASSNAIVLEPGVAMWSLHFLAISDTSLRYKGRYQGQKGIMLPKALKDYDTRI